MYNIQEALDTRMCLAKDCGMTTFLESSTMKITGTIETLTIIMLVLILI